VLRPNAGGRLCMRPAPRRRGLWRRVGDGLVERPRLPRSPTRTHDAHARAYAYSSPGAESGGAAVACACGPRDAPIAKHLLRTQGKSRRAHACTRPGTNDGRLLLLSLQYEEGDDEGAGGALPAKGDGERRVSGAHVEMDVSLGHGPVAVDHLVRV